MRTPTLVLVALSFCGGLLLHCDVGVPAWADEEEDPKPIPVHRSGARLKAIVEVSDDGAVIPTGEWFDTELETRCVPAYASDGSRRCLPVETKSSTAQLGEDCTGVEVVSFNSGEEPTDPFVVVGRGRIRLIGQEVEPANGIFYDMGEGFCLHTPREDLNPSVKFFELGEEVEPEAFALLTKAYL